MPAPDDRVDDPQAQHGQEDPDLVRTKLEGSAHGFEVAAVLDRLLRA